MLPFLDKPIELILKRTLHKKRQKYINDTIASYTKKHPDLAPEKIQQLREALELEIERVFAIADSSILHARISVARWVFWLTAICGTAITVAVAHYPLTTPLVVLFVPLMTAFVAWAVTVATVGSYYNDRIIGGLDSALVVFENKLKEEAHKEQKQDQLNEIAELRKMVMQMQNELAAVRSERGMHVPVPEDDLPGEISRVVLSGATLFQPETTAVTETIEAVPTARPA